MSTDAPTSSDVQPTVSDDAFQKSVPAEVGEAGIAAGIADAAVVAEGGKLKPKQKGARKPKPCTRCDERRKREREYARASRVRAKLTKDSDAPAEVGGDATMEAGADAAPAPPAAAQ